MNPYRNEDTFLDKVEDFFVWLTRFINAVFMGINALITNIEYSFLNMVTVIIPWLVFLAPASMTWQNTGEHLGFPLWLRWVVAAVVEGLGLVAGSQLLDDIWHNRKKENRAKERKVNPFISGMASVFYLIITISLNALLDVYGDQAWAQILARTMITTMGAVAIAIIAVRGLRNVMRFGESVRGQMSDTSDSTGSYNSYDYRTEIGNVLSVEEKSELLDKSRSNLKRWIENNYPGINPDIASRWIRYIERDVEGG